MRLGSVIEVARSPVGRLLGALAGLGAVLLLLRHTGTDVVVGAIQRGAIFLPWLALLELATLGASMAALCSLYGPIWRRIPFAQLIRTGLLGYAVAGLVPVGRTAAEATRAALLAPYVGGARAAAAATRLQGVALVANALVTAPALWATYHRLGWDPVTWAVAANLVATLVLGGAILVAGFRLRMGAWLGRRSERVRDFGASLDDHLREGALLPPSAVAFESLSRLFQVAQCGLLVAAVGGVPGIGAALRAEGVLLVGGAVGDLVPAQLGATEATYTFSARALGLAPGDAMAIALLAHLVQLGWVAVGSVLPLLWPAPRRS